MVRKCVVEVALVLKFVVCMRVYACVCVCMRVWIAHNHTQVARWVCRDIDDENEIVPVEQEAQVNS